MAKKVDIIDVMLAVNKGELKVTVHNGFFTLEHTKSGERVRLNKTDAVPVVHGWWELEGNDDELGCSYFCSNCQDSFDEDWFYVTGKYRHFNYCPNCGARMDL